MQAADDPCTSERPGRAELLAQGHQPRHLGLGDRDLPPPPIGERNVGDLVVVKGRHPDSPDIGHRDIYTYLYTFARNDPARHHDDKIEGYPMVMISFGETALGELPCRFPAGVRL